MLLGIRNKGNPGQYEILYNIPLHIVYIGMDGKLKIIGK